MKKRLILTATFVSCAVFFNSAANVMHHIDNAIEAASFDTVQYNAGSATSLVVLKADTQGKLKIKADKRTLLTLLSFSGASESYKTAASEKAQIGGLSQANGAVQTDGSDKIDQAFSSIESQGYAKKIADGDYVFSEFFGKMKLDENVSILSLEIVGASSIKINGDKLPPTLYVMVSSGSVLTANSPDTIDKIVVAAQAWGIVDACDMQANIAQVQASNRASVSLNAKRVYIPKGSVLGGFISNTNSNGITKFGLSAEEDIAPAAKATPSSPQTVEVLPLTTEVRPLGSEINAEEKVQIYKANGNVTVNSGNVSVGINNDTDKFSISTANGNTVINLTSQETKNKTYPKYNYNQDYADRDAVNVINKAFPQKDGYYYEDIVSGYLGDYTPKFLRKKRFRGQWMGIEFGFNYYATPKSGLSTEWPENTNGYENMQLNYSKSGSFAWNVFQVSIGFNSRNWGLVTGMGFLWDNYRFDNPSIIPSKENGNVSFRPYSESDRYYKKSKLSVSYFRIPILFEYNNAKGAFRSFHASVGVIPSVKMMSWTKQKYEDLNGRTHKEKNKSDFYINPFKLDVVAYVGWGPLSVYFSYTPTHLFLHNKGVDLTPFGFGMLIGCH